jgi:hypothetical protein
MLIASMVVGPEKNFWLATAMSGSAMLFAEKVVVREKRN